MIKSTDLRIGNMLLLEARTRIVCGIMGSKIFSWAFIDGKPIIQEITRDVSGVMEEDPVMELIHEYSPIELTPEILEKCGFKNSIIFGDQFKCGEVEILRYESRAGYLLLNGEDSTAWSKVYKYLHEIQNLYHSLTGGELTVNL